MIPLSLVAIKLATKQALFHLIPKEKIMNIDKQLAFAAGAALVSGVATAVIAPSVASLVTDPKKPENWYATGSVAIALGAGIMVAGSLMGKNAPAIAAGAAMVGVGASFAYLSYQATRPAALPDPKTTDTSTAVKGFVGLGNIAGRLPVSNPGNYASLRGLTPTQRYYAQRGGMPVRSGR